MVFVWKGTGVPEAGEPGGNPPV